MAAVIQRPLRGSRVSTFYPVKNLPSLSSLDSAFQLQEYISLLIRLDVHDVDAIISFPGTSEKDKKREGDKDEGAKEGDKDSEKAKNEVTVDEGCWIYEQLRRLAQDLSHPLITTLQQECTRASCPEMKAGEWLYLCVAHGNDGAMEQCCAIDYILHTVDSATALLNSPRTFPSRLSIPQTSHRHFASLARRLGRIFAHAYYHHREAFEQAEAESSLYARFLALTEKFNLVPAEFLVIPPNNFPQDDAGPSREREPSLYDYNDPGRGGVYHPTNQQPQPQSGSAEHFLPSRGYRQHEYHGMESEPTHPSSIPESNSGGASPNGGVGETPNVTRSRFGRSRTDTMVFNDSEASAIADELAAKARAGQLEPESQQSPSHTQLESEEKAVEQEDEEDEEEGDLEGETHFEISLSPEEEIHGTYGEFTDPSAHHGEDGQAHDAATTSQSSTVAALQPEELPSEEEKLSHVPEEKAEEPAISEPVAEKEVAVARASQPQEVAPETVIEPSAGESVVAPAPPPASTSTSDEVVGEVQPETTPDAALVKPAQPVEESDHSGKADLVEAVIPTPSAVEASSPSSSDVEVPASSTEKESTTVEPSSVISSCTEAVVHADEVGEGATSEEINSDEIRAIEETTGAGSEPSEVETKVETEAEVKAEGNLQVSLSTISEPDAAAVQEDQSASGPPQAP